MVRVSESGVVLSSTVPLFLHTQTRAGREGERVDTMNVTLIVHTGYSALQLTITTETGYNALQLTIVGT
jgi:hypothetical protein